MYDDIEKHHLLKAIKAFKRRLIVVSPEFRILALNRSENEVAEADVIGKLCYEEFYDRTSPCDGCAVQVVLETGGPSLRPKPDDTIDLGRMPCYYSYPIYDGDTIEAFVSMDFDLLTTGELEEKLQQSNALLRNLIHSAVDCVIAAGKKGNILIFNEAASEVFGYTEEEALSRINIGDIYPGKLAYQVMEKLRGDAVGGRGKLSGYQVNVLSKSGEEIPISLNASIVYEKGVEVATIGLFHDLREKLRMQEELKTTQFQLLQSEKMASLGKLAAGVAHQLNNPLGGITLYSKLILEEYDLETGIEEDLNRILKDAERCRDTVKELLEFARQTRHLMQPHDINRAILRTLFLLESQTLFHNIDIKKELSPTLPRVKADIQQLNHLFMNIILNAAQAMEGRGRLILRTVFLPDRERVRIEISDTGPGIPEDLLPNIFEPFFTTKEEGEGTGLGLSLAYGIVENHGGSITAKSQPGEGTTFFIELPLKNQRPPAELVV